ncbi:MAG: hypothetical protein WCW66_02730 [Patescibacteria group bacterium]|jgi:predicted Rossmann-fold nucleotide-binding protein
MINEKYMKSREGEQPELFFEQDAELKDLAQRVKYRVSLLGGGNSEESARILGHDLTERFYPIQTGGYDTGAMKGGLEGANQAINEMRQDTHTKELLSLVYPYPKGITAERFAPAWVPKGEHIKIEVAEGNKDMYLRLGILMEDSSATIVLPGDAGTELEVFANLHFDKKLKPKFQVESKPLIVIGDSHIELMRKFETVINDSDNVYIVQDETEALELVDVLRKLDNQSDLDEGEVEQLNEFRIQRRLKFEK